MKSKQVVFVAIALAGLTAVAYAQMGGSFIVVRNSVDSSSASSTGGDYELFSVVNQPVVELDSASTGGSFSIKSGFLALPPEIRVIQNDAWIIN